MGKDLILESISLVDEMEEPESDEEEDASAAEEDEEAEEEESTPAPAKADDTDEYVYFPSRKLSANCAWADRLSKLMGDVSIKK